MLAVCAFAPVVSGAFAASESRPAVAIAGFEFDEESRKFEKTLRDEIELNFFNSRSFRILERERVDLILKEKSLKENLSGSGAIVSAGKMLTADYFVTGSISTLLGKAILNIRVIRVEDGSILYAYVRRIDRQGSLRRYLKKMSALIVEDIRWYLEKGYPRKREESYQTAVDEPVDNISFDLYGSFQLPAGEFADRAEYAFGGGAALSFRDIFVPGLSAGVDAGLLRYEFSSTLGGYMLQVPLLLRVCYAAAEFGQWSLQPVVRAGAVYMSYHYPSGETVYQSGPAIEFMADAGLSASRMLTYNVGMRFSLYCGLVAERESFPVYAGAGTGIFFLF